MMTNQQILEKAIRKAIDGGWLGDELKDEHTSWRLVDAFPRSYLSVSIPNTKAFDDFHEVKIYTFELLYRHDFAKSLWPNLHMEVTKKWPNGVATGTAQSAWQYHLQMMVISENPIEYLGANL